MSLTWDTTLVIYFWSSSPHTLTLKFKASGKSVSHMTYGDNLVEKRHSSLSSPRSRWPGEPLCTAFPSKGHHPEKTWTKSDPHFWTLPTEKETARADNPLRGTNRAHGWHLHFMSHLSTSHFMFTLFLIFRMTLKDARQPRKSSLETKTLKSSIFLPY